MAVAIPTGVQIFCWIATIWSGRPVWKTPLYFVIGFLFIFVLGGLTGVMVAVVPFDWQVHDTYFVVAHLHYVLIGGMVFPLFAAFYYWMPLFTGRMLSERLGKLAFWLMFIGFNIDLLSHAHHRAAGDAAAGRQLSGGFRLGHAEPDFQPRLGRAGARHPRVHRGFRDPSALGNEGAAQPLERRHAGMGDGASQPGYGSPQRADRHRTLPDLGQSELPEQIQRGDFFLPDSPQGRRETLRTGSVDARPEQILILPKPSWLPLLAGVTTTAAFGVSIFYMWTLAALLAAATLALILAWAWNSEIVPTGETEHHVGRGDLPALLRDRTEEPCLVGHGGADRGRCRRLWRVVVRLSLHLDSQSGVAA